ncbi:MAG: Flp family type IVb pilin [Hyphomicrobiales bacterium]|nr:Flp family type IVb pilin [Hyphomicrobiales bacterium]
MQLLQKFIRDTEAAVAIEYSMIGVFMSVMLIGGASAIGNKLNSHFNAMAAGLL